MASLQNRADPARVERKMKKEIDELIERRIGDLMFLIAEDERRKRANKVLNPQPRKKF